MLLFFFRVIRRARLEFFVGLFDTLGNILFIFENAINPAVAVVPVILKSTKSCSDFFLLIKMNISFLLQFLHLSEFLT